ncbi:MAG TPA: alpha/beta fold hydrolase [Thermoanaerobaculia bacterium]
MTCVTNETIVLIHGLHRTCASMWPLAVAAKRRGYRVINWCYPSRRRTIEEHAEAFATEVAPRLATTHRVHFITHSLGGIIVRRFLATHALPNVGHVVMLAPPNGGSEVADRLGRIALLRKVTGKPVRQLGTGAGSVPNTLPRATFPVGIIAGSRSNNPLFGKWIAEPNDGKVSVSRTRLEGMRAHLVLRRTHTFLPWAPDAIGEALRFVECGAFGGGER